MNNTISIKIEGEEDQILQLSNGRQTFNLASGIIDDSHFAMSEDLASILGNPSSESLTMYKSEPVEQEYYNDNQGASEGGGSDFLYVYQSGGETYPPAPPTVIPKLVQEPMEIDNAESSSSSSDSDDDNSSASDGDNDTSAKSEDERDGLNESERRRDPIIPSKRRRSRNEKLIQEFNRRRKCENNNIGVEGEKSQEIELEKSVENFVHEHIEDYLNRRGFRYPMTVPSTISKGIFASIILPETARMNTITFGPQYEVHEVPDEIERFWKFYLHLKEHFPKLANELKQVLVPILLYFFQDCCNSGLGEVAKQLQSTYGNRFLQEDRSQETYTIIRNLTRICASNSFDSDDYFQNIRHREFRFLFSEPVFEKLKHFLSRRGSPVLTHLFASKFVIQLKETADVVDTFLERPRSSASLLSISSSTDQYPEHEPDSQRIENLVPHPRISLYYSGVPRKRNVRRARMIPANVPLPDDFQPILFDKEEPNLRLEKKEAGNSKKRISLAGKAIYLLRNSVEANIPSIRLHTLSGKPICAAVSEHGSLLAFGMSTSVINVCFTSQKDLDRFKMEIFLEKAKPCKTKTNPRKRTLDTFEMENTEPNTSETTAKSIDDSNGGQVEESVKMINRMFGHEGPVSDLTFHPKTRLLFSVGYDGTLRAWDLNTFKCRYVYRGHAAPIWCMDMTDSGHMIVTGSMDTTARIWVTEKTEYVRLLAGHYFDVECVKFHPNEAYVATGSVDKSVRLWSVSDGNLVRVFTGATSGVSTIAFHESGKYIIGGGEDSFMRIWNIAEGELKAELPSPIGLSSCCRRVTLCQNMLAAAFEDNTVRIWNLRELFGGNTRFTFDAHDMNLSSSSASDSEGDAHLTAYYKTLIRKSRGKNGLPSENKPKEDQQSTPRDSTSNSNGNDNSSDWESLSSCSITEDELEPIEMKVSNNAVRLPAPKIIHCDSSNILRLYYRDFGHLYTLGSQIEVENVSDDTTSEIPPPEVISVPSTRLENEDEEEYLPDSVRPMLISAGIHRWPIPVERLTSSDEEEAPVEGSKPNEKNSKPSSTLTPSQIAESQKIRDNFMQGVSDDTMVPIPIENEQNTRW